MNPMGSQSHCKKSKNCASTKKFGELFSSRREGFLYYKWSTRIEVKNLMTIKYVIIRSRKSGRKEFKACGGFFVY